MGQESFQHERKFALSFPFNAPSHSFHTEPECHGTGSKALSWTGDMLDYSTAPKQTFFLKISHASQTLTKQLIFRKVSFFLIAMPGQLQLTRLIEGVVSSKFGPIPVRK